MINWGNVFELVLIMSSGVICWELGKFVVGYLIRRKQGQTKS